MNTKQNNISQGTSAEMGRVAVLCGGLGNEREVSLQSGSAVLAALLKRSVDAFLVDGVEELVSAIHAKKVDRVFNILHGGAGENGEVQGLLRALQVPCTGCSLAAAALSMDKVRSKKVWQATQLPTTDFIAVDSATAVVADDVVAKLGLPLIVKPAQEGSTVGVERVYAAAEIPAAIEQALRFDTVALIEPLIDGVDVTIAVLNGEALPSVRIEPSSGFYDYHAKYLAEDTGYYCPGVEKSEEIQLQSIALAAFEALGCSGWGRVDFMRRVDGEYFLLEVNTTPGMTSHSLVPMAAAEAGIDFEELVWCILQSSC